MNETEQSDYWSFWQRPAAENSRWNAEASDLVERLIALVQPLPTWHVLDYGCGQGLVAARLAESVKALDLWDKSPVARKLAQKACKDNPNATVLSSLPQRPTYDFILVSSVTQYMTEDDLKGAFAEWKQMLKVDGQVLVTDIIPPQRRIVSEIGALIRFAARYRLLGHMISVGIRELPSYFRRSQQSPLFHYDPETIAAAALALGFDVETVPNPNMFPSRYAVLLCLNQI